LAGFQTQLLSFVQELAANSDKNILYSWYKWERLVCSLLHCIFHLFCMLVQHLHVSSQLVCSQSEVIF
jgi:hypothetical protein